MVRHSPILGMILLILGFAFLFVAIAPFFKSILFAILAIYLINLGFRMRGVNDTAHFARTWWVQIRRPR